MSASLWRMEDVLSATSGACDAVRDNDFSSVSIDSRTVEPGALFVAIRGERLDGHAFVARAFAAGAAGAIVETDWHDPEAEGTCIRVADTLEALNELGAAARTRTGARVIAITGSVGKTSSKEALRLALGGQGAVHASEKSYNNHWGVPLSLSLMPERTDYGVFEIGMNHAGEIVPLTRLVRPHVAIVTTVAPVHLEFFATVEDIAEAKAEIFQGLETGGTAILNRDNPHFDLLRRRAEEAGAGRIVGFGRSPDADARLIDARPGPEGSDVEAMIDGAQLRYRIGAPGAHLVTNSLAVLAAAGAVGADVAGAAASLGRMAAQKGRGARSETGGMLIIDESYNANPASMRAALETLAHVPRESYPRRVAVLGDMLELGAEGEALHRGLADAVDASGADIVFACGPQMAALYEALPASRRGEWREAAEDLQPLVLAAVGRGDAVMVKGSLGSRMGPIVEALKSRGVEVDGEPLHAAPER